jgi:hypothetical protein
MGDNRGEVFGFRWCLLRCAEQHNRNACLSLLPLGSYPPNHFQPEGVGLVCSSTHSNKPSAARKPEGFPTAASDPPRSSPQGGCKPFETGR